MNRLTVPSEGVSQMFGTAGTDSLLRTRHAAVRAITGIPFSLNIKLGLHSWIKKNESTVAYSIITGISSSELFLSHCFISVLPWMHPGPCDVSLSVDRSHYVSL